MWYSLCQGLNNRISRDLTGGLFDRNCRKTGEREREQGVPVSNLTRLGGEEIATTTFINLESMFASEVDG